MKMNLLLRTLSLVVLMVFIFTVALPSYGLQESNYLVSAPQTVSRGDSFDFTITPVNTTLNLNDITISLPSGLTADRYPVTTVSNGSYSYRILTGQYTGSFNIMITIASSSGSPVTLVRTVTVQPTFFDTYGPWIIIGAMILIVGLSSGSGGGRY